MPGAAPARERGTVGRSGDGGGRLRGGKGQQRRPAQPARQSGLGTLCARRGRQRRNTFAHRGIEGPPEDAGVFRADGL